MMSAYFHRFSCQRLDRQQADWFRERPRRADREGGGSPKPELAAAV